jgi:hypothetical protein
MSEMLKPSAYKPFMLLMVMFMLQQACGGFAVVFYAVNVFQVGAGSRVARDTYTK